tara:strand:+ start:346 stop:513 length:168 start_codon:yes stop_codon:yes gene_type:complete
MSAIGNFMAGFLGTFGILLVKSLSDIGYSYLSPSGSTLEEALEGTVSNGGNGGRY